MVDEWWHATPQPGRERPVAFSHSRSLVTAERRPDEWAPLGRGRRAAVSICWSRAMGPIRIGDPLSSRQSLPQNKSPLTLVRSAELDLASSVNGSGSDRPLIAVPQPNEPGGAEGDESGGGCRCDSRRRNKGETDVNL